MEEIKKFITEFYTDDNLLIYFGFVESFNALITVEFAK